MQVIASIAIRAPTPGMTIDVIIWNMSFILLLVCSPQILSDLLIKINKKPAIKDVENDKMQETKIHDSWSGLSWNSLPNWAIHLECFSSSCLYIPSS